MAAGGRAARAVAVMGLALAGCWTENPAFFVTEGGQASGAGGATGEPGSTGAPIDEPDTTGTTTTTDATTTTSPATTEPATTTAVDPSDATSTTTTGPDTTGPDLTTTSTGTTGGDATTGEDVAPTCGASGLGPAELLARRWYGLIPQACGDIPRRNYKIVGANQGMVVAIPCSDNPMAGCVGCDASKSLTFAFHTPEPDGELTVGPCVYLSAHGAIDQGGQQPCRFQQMALWWDGSATPAKQPPLAVFGHDTLAVDPAVQAVHDAALSIELEPLDGECACVDPLDCCPEKAVEYALRFVSGEAVAVPPGQHAAVELAGASYDAYNGQAHEPGACAQEQVFDWWLLRQ